MCQSVCVRPTLLNHMTCDLQSFSKIRLDSFLVDRERGWEMGSGRGRRVGRTGERLVLGGASEQRVGGSGES